MTVREQLKAAFEIGRHPLILREVSTQAAGNHAIERLAFATASGEPVRGLLTRPATTGMRHPAILYIHAHGNRHDIGAGELLDGRPALQGALGAVFAGESYVTLCIDLPAFGRRAGESEQSLAKARLWEGRSLAGQMLGELHSALDYLARRPDVLVDRIGAFGISMGATFGYWLAAVDERLGAVAHLCCYANFRPLIETGAHDLHGLYLTIPGLLNIASNGEIAGLVAPRPQLICLGERDPLTPRRAVEPALGETRAAYARHGVAERLTVLREAEAGHEETPAMRAAVLAFFRTALAP